MRVRGCKSSRPEAINGTQVAVKVFASETTHSTPSNVSGCVGINTLTKQLKLPFMGSKKNIEFEKATVEMM